MKTSIILNGIVLGALALAGSAWSLTFFASTSELAEQGEVFEGGFKLDEVFLADVESSFILNERDSLTVLPASEVYVEWNADANHLEVELFKGSVLFSTLANDMTVSVHTDFVQVDSQNSTALVTLNQELSSASVFALDHPSLVTFMENGETLNALSVPGAYRMTVPSSKVSETLAKLRLTKLSKEFPVYALSDGDLSESATLALNASEKRYADQSVAFLNHLQDVSDFGPSTEGVGSTLISGYQSFQNALTVVPTAKERLTEARKHDALLYAMSHLAYADVAQGDAWLQEWLLYPQDLDELDELYSELFFVLPGDELYPVKEAVATLLYPEEEPIVALRRQLIQIESLLGRASQVDALQAYQGYQDQFELALQSGEFDDPEDLDVINREYVLVELMLRSNAVFYSVDATQLLQALEDKILALAGSDSDLDEERQAFVQSKIRFLTNLFTFVVDKKVSVANATELANELIFEAENHLNSIQTKVAVQDYFEGQISEFKFSVQFMTSPEFYTYDSFEEGLDDYKIKLADLEDLNAYLQDIRSGNEEEETTLTLEEATEIAKDDLYTHAIQYKELVPLGDTAYRLFEIVNGRTAGYAFTAHYDRESQILYDVVVGEVRFSTGLTLENAKLVIEEAMAGQNELEDSSENSTDESGESSSNEESSLTESVALEHVRDLFEDADLDPNDFVFTVVDLEENLFSFEGSMTQLSLPVSGTYNSDTGLVTEIVWELNSVPYPLEDLDLEALESALEASYDSTLE